MSDPIEQILSREWFYRFELPDGRSTPTYHGGELDSIHDTRWQMVDSHLTRVLGDDWAGLSAIDLASHQGYFATRMAQRGMSRVLGIDARESHIEDSKLIASVYNLNQLRFSQADVHELDASVSGRFDVVLMLGLLYHLENPVGALRTAKALCSRVCMIETQVVPGMTGFVDYGSYKYVRPLKGSFGLIDETNDTHGPEASVTGICLVPSLDGLLWMLEKVGFSEIFVLEPPEDAYEQLRYGKRVMVAAHV
jgi:ubiquinone/menaquinone biosynthesis C-methylase UbiE